VEELEKQKDRVDEGGARTKIMIKSRTMVAHEYGDLCQCRIQGRVNRWTTRTK
jgi:hypothetical protein